MMLTVVAVESCAETSHGEEICFEVRVIRPVHYQAIVRFIVL